MIHLQRSMIENLQAVAPTPQSVITALQQAVELEHATIPLYLYALYSLDSTRNQEIADIIQSVVIEEMLHMTLASNVLNALGGTSQVGQPGFIPTYPGPLPGGVESSQTFNLAPFSMTQLGAFIELEKPEDPLIYQTRQLALLSGTLKEDFITIGEFYSAISTAIGLLGDSAFANPPRNQVGSDLMPESIIVTDVTTAQQAISTIVDQGEGTRTSPEEVVGNSYAHYYRFLQIQKARLLVITTEAPGYAYAGTPVLFDAQGVYAVPTNPGVAGYPAGTGQAFANDNFNYTYSSLLLALNALFSGQASNQHMNTAIGLMMSLKGQAKAMMSGIPNPAVMTGPSFQYQPVNP